MTDVTEALVLYEHPDGVYLNLAEGPYHADPALGSTSVKMLKVNPPEWWDTSPHNPDRPPEADEDTKARLLGTAAHVLFLEGMDTFDEVYGFVPTRADYPEALSLNDDLKRKLAEYSLPTSGTKEVLIQRIRDNKIPGVIILDELVQQFAASGKRPISRREFRILARLYAMAMRSPDEIRLNHGEVVTLKEAFTGGLSEVSMFWTDENGVRHKARFDKLKPNSTTDLKTIGKWQHEDFKQSLLREVRNRKYPIQMAQYEEARTQMGALVAAGLVFGGSDEQRAYLEECAQATEWAWIWIFAKTVGAPALKAIVLPRTYKIYNDALQDREEAIANYLAFKAQFDGTGEMWIDTDTIWEPSEDDWAMAGLY